MLKYGICEIPGGNGIRIETEGVYKTVPAHAREIALRLMEMADMAEVAKDSQGA